MDLLNRFHEGHERVKHAVHSYWRQNTILSPKGRFGKAVMSCFYFSIPVVAAYFGVNRIADASESAAQERFGDQADAVAKHKHKPTEAISVQKIGAGGWGGGVNLATSDRDTQDVNRINLERFLKKQRKLKEKREREAAANAAGRD